jgi:hypothetical protein
MKERAIDKVTTDRKQSTQHNNTIQNSKKGQKQREGGGEEKWDDSGFFRPKSSRASPPHTPSQTKQGHVLVHHGSGI